MAFPVHLCARCPGSGHRWEEYDSLFFTFSSEIFIRVGWILLSLLFCRLSSPSSLCVSLWQILLSLNHLHVPLDSAQYVHVSLVVGSQALEALATSTVLWRASTLSIRKWSVEARFGPMCPSSLLWQQGHVFYPGSEMVPFSGFSSLL